MMEIAINSELQKFVEDQVNSGCYTSSSDVVEEALALLYDRDHQITEFTPEHDAYIRRSLAEAEDDMKHGRFIEVDDEGLRQMFEEIKRRGRERLAAINDVSK